MISRDKVIPLERGPDGLISQTQYDPRELVTRIKPILRRVKSGIDNRDTIRPIFELNYEARNILFHDKLLELTAAEFDILSILIKNKTQQCQENNFYMRVSI